jgi:hypothetical protein
MKIAIKLDISTGGSSDKENSEFEDIRSADAPAGGWVQPDTVIKAIAEAVASEIRMYR